MAASDRTRIPVPDLDDRTWADLVEGARALIPRYAPQWTNHTASDIGMTLIELFAWQVEGLIYRLNQVPEKNYAEFLNLLNVRRNPPEPARADLTFAATSAVTVPAGTRAETPRTETEDAITFETDQSVNLLPVNLVSLLSYAKAAGGRTYRNHSAGLTRPGGGTGTVVTVAAQSQSAIGFGFDQATTQEIVLGFELVPPLPMGVPLAAAPVAVIWTYSEGANALTQVQPVQDGTAGLTIDGRVRLQLPTTWAAQPADAAFNPVTPASTVDTEPASRHWLWALLDNPTQRPLALGLRRVQFNSAVAHAALTTGPETLGTSDGRPFQLFALGRAPLFRRPGTLTPYAHLKVTVNGLPWSAVEEIPAGPGQVFRFDPVAGEIMFGNHDPVTRPDGHGSIPPAGASIVAQNYRYVAGGRSANVGGGAVSLLASSVPGVISVTNHAPAAGGADQEPIEDAKRRAPEALRTRDRAVTPDDYEILAKNASTEIARARALEPRVHDGKFPTTAPFPKGYPWTFAGIDRAHGSVNVIVVPKLGPIPELPEPSVDLLLEVQAALDRRRDLTARVLAIGPRYLPVRVTASVAVWDSAITQGLVADVKAVEDAVKSAIKKFLHPVTGGPRGTGWDVGQAVYVSDVYAAIMPDQSVGYIETIALAADVPLYHDPLVAFSQDERPERHPVGVDMAWVRVADYELVCAGVPNITANKV